jgi:predicted AlkP superfamily pyrophosphatase or phosphodiesterase
MDRSSRRISSVILSLCLALCLAGCSASAPAVEEPPGQRPSLVVVIAVDQLGEDLLERYDKLFTGGFRRLRDQGMSFSEARVDHAITISHPGHVTLATGDEPARHGIVDAAFYEGPPGARKLVDALADPGFPIVGARGLPGASPQKILASTLSEWIAAADPQARVVALGSGQYSSLLHAGHARGDVYWYAGAVGRYVTSSFYRADDAAWVTDFNQRTLPLFMQKSRLWESTVPEAARSLARPDASPYEARGRFATFPHRFEDEVPPAQRDDPRALPWRLSVTPMLDEATLSLAQDAVRAQELGRRGTTDILSIVVSQVDDIGHWYGPRSQEQLDNLLRLDRELGEFLTFLDQSVGAGRYVLALSADHAAPDIPEHRREAGETARRITEAETKAVLDEVRAVIAQATQAGTPDEIAARVAAAVKRHDFVAAAMTPAELAGSSADGHAGDPFLTLYRNSWRPDRVPRFPLFTNADGASPIGEAGVMVRLTEGAMIDGDPAVHGSPYDYDRRVPLVFFGAGVRPGRSAEPARTIDLAPTLARLAGIPVPPEVDGRALLGPRGAQQ